ncbi:MAG TPA: tryptophan synthase subunit alpha [Candidatus Omnitrophota bacterium]|nr:tryptophan synthase subunit alpha [Candidatus Omnitrophota bacterium]
MNRIERKFKILKERRKKAFIAFITAGYPSLKTTEDLAVAFEDAGVDILEIGIPFSDPLADGPTIQASSFESLKRGTTLAGIFDTVVRIRKRSQIPIALMTYYNPVFHFGDERFISRAAQVGVDGVIVPDLPPDEAKGLIASCRKNDVASIFFISPTTTEARMKKVAVSSTGFIYYVSVTGVTGERKQVSQRQIRPLAQARGLTDKPICVGFGISTPEQVRSLSQKSDGVIVGSAIVREVTRNLGKKDLVQRTASFVKRLAGVL